jgi:hypothetical protein
MNYLLLLLILLGGCQFIPEMAKDLESIETDTAIRIEVSRETFQKETDLQINVNVQNKDSKIPVKTSFLRESEKLKKKRNSTIC